MKTKAKSNKRAKQILKQVDDNPKMFRVISLPKTDFNEVRNYLGEHASRIEFKYRDTVIKQI